MPAASRPRHLLLLLLLPLLGCALGILDAARLPDSRVFLIYNSELPGCLETKDSLVKVSKICNTSAPAQKWKWVSRSRLFNIGAMQCLGVSWKSANTSTAAHALATYECDQESVNMRWNCRTLGDHLSQYLSSRLGNWSLASAERSDQAQRGQWKVYGQEDDLCSVPYSEIYTIQGNSHGKPCTIPFKYDNMWFYDCTSMGREDEHLWCATTQDYGKDERWGFCPIKSNDCDTFWDRDHLTGSCYQFNFQSTLSWQEAGKSCEQQGASLLSITEIHEQTYINGLLTGYSSTLWIGLNDLDLSGGWQWSDSSPLKFLNWEDRQPDNPQEENCGVIRTESSGGWQNRDCSIALPYICKKKPNATSDTYLAVDSWLETKVDCDPSWQPFQSSCYRLISEKKTWPEAKKTCLRNEGDLVSLHTLAELEFVTKQIKQDVEELWIGLNDLRLQMNFEWSDGTPVQFTFWHPFEPNNFRDDLEDCVTIWGPEGRWNDSPCNQTLPSVCKKKGRVNPGREDEDHGCGKGWKWHTPSCYWVGDERVKYVEAWKICLDYRATLLTITNRFEQAFVNSLIYSWEDEYFWTALQDMNETGSFRWLSGDEVTYTHWNRNQPDYSKGGCVALATGSAMGLWEVKNCATFRAKYICRQNLGTPVNPEPSAPRPTPSLTGSCPPGWSTSSKMRHCYKVFHYEQLQEKKSWIMAHVFCQELKAQLLSLGSYEEDHFVASMLNKIFGELEPEIHEQHWFWIGLNRRAPGAELLGQSWQWSDGLGFSYHNFDRSHHDHDDIRNCAVLDLASLQWMPLECGTHLDWICKLPKGTDVKDPEIPNQGSSEWVKYQDAEYKFFSLRSNWVQAQRICTWFQADLASVHSQAELDFLGQNLKKFSRGQDQYWWIGLNTYENDGRFRWSDHSLLNFISWAPGKPRPISKDKKCVYMTASQEDWGDQKCHTALPFICKYSNSTSTNVQPPLPVPSPGSCAQGWSTHRNKCFMIHAQEQVTWPEAKRTCEIQGGTLATISNHMEQAFITTLLPNNTFDLWIGLHDAKKEFQWVDSEPVKYMNWAPGEPSGYGTSPANEKPTNCAIVWHGPPPQFTGRWDDRNCLEEKHAFICQKSKDPTLAPSPADYPPTANSTLSYLDGVYRILTKPLTWQEAVLLCGSFNASLTNVMEPYTQAFLTQVVSSVPAPLWIGLSNEEGRRNYVWFTDESLSYTNWQDGEPQQIMGCTYMDADGTWRTAGCDTKLQGAICRMNTGLPSSHRWSYNGSCPNSLEDSSWIPFRNHCYAFHMEVMLGPREAVKKCQKVGGTMLSVQDEMENIFVWEHLQAYETPSRGAWLGMTFNPKGGKLVWHDNMAMNYSNWGQHDTGPNMLSPKSCYWIQSSDGVWGLGSCTNVTMGVICKTPRVEESNFSRSGFLENTKAIAVVILSSLALCILVAAAICLYKRQWGSEQRAFESARYSRTNSSPSESAEKDILVSDMEMNEQQD